MLQLVVTDFVLQSFMDGEDGPTWTLFVADGTRLRAVLGPVLLSHAQCNGACRDVDVDVDAGQRRTRTLSLAPAHVTHQGLRDLVATLRDSVHGAATSVRLRFDGRRYQLELGRLVVR